MATLDLVCKQGRFLIQVPPDDEYLMTHLLDRILSDLVSLTTLMESGTIIIRIEKDKGE